MSRRTLNILGILILMGITAAVSIFAYVYMVGGSGEASVTLSAPTLDLSTPTPNAALTQVAELEATNAALSTAVAEAQQAAPTAQAEESTVEPTAAPTEEATVEAAAVPAGTVYTIDAENSQVSFTLTEDLRGTFTTVVGTTNQVAGEIFVDFATPANSKIGVIRINARSLSTDNDFRNRAIRGEILQSANDAYEFIEFTPTALEGLPDTVAAGSSVSFKVVGDLKIREIVQPVTFDVSLTANADKLEGTAIANVTRTQYDLQIPNAPGVANVSDEVRLDISFVAVPKGGDEAGVTAAEATVEPTAVPAAEATVESTVEAAASAGTLYSIDANSSQVSFTLTEDLRGVPTTVVGTTNQVAGEIFVDFTNPANSKVGVIRINARTLSTDSEFRNRALRGEILESSKDEYQFIEFTPTSIEGLPDTVAVGATVNFKVVGDLKIRNIVQPVTFDVSVTANADKLEGAATAAVTRAQYDLQIPNAPGVANVSDEVTLDIKFVAPVAAS